MPQKNFNYKQLSAELDDILAKLQSEELDVDEALKAYEKGMEITKELDKYLKDSENKIKRAHLGS